MNWLLLATVILLLFSFVILFGAPYLPTHKAREEDIFKLLSLKPGQTMLELGSGDGRILKLAGQRGIRAIGYELNPVLVMYSKMTTWKYRHLVRVQWGNYWQLDWPATDAIYTFLLQRYMPKLDKKIMQECRKPVKLVSYAFHIEGRKPTKEINGMFLYTYK